MKDFQGNSARCCIDGITSGSAATEQRRTEVKEKFHHRDHGGRREEGPEDVLVCDVYADGNYWAGAGWEDYAVSDLDEGERRREIGFAGNACGRGEGAGATARRARQALQP